jgi:DNA-binding transcriptional LysR family regulator
MAIDLFQIETFLAVAREGSFSRAAQKLFRTQPAVSQTIRRLEQELGEPLFDRSSREGILTDAGLALMDYAERMLNLRTEALTAIQSLRQLERGRLAISANEFTCLYLLPILDDFRHHHPMVQVCVQRTLASRVANEVQNRNAELGVLTFKPDDPTLRSMVVYRDELAFVVPPRHPLARARQASIRQLGAEMFVAHNVPSPYRAKVIETFARRKVPLHMDVELPSIEAIKKFVASGNGVALLPMIAVESEVARGDLVHVPVPELRFERKLRVVFGRSAALSHAARAFLAIAQEFAERSQGRFMYRPER